MAITYNWAINLLECYPTASENKDVVFLAHWQLTAISGSYTESVIGAQKIKHSTSSIFVPFKDLTLDTVQSWVENSMGNSVLQIYKDNLNKKIEDKISPTITILKSPWIDKNNIALKTPIIQKSEFLDFSDDQDMIPPMVIETIMPPPGLIKLI